MKKYRIYIDEVGNSDLESSDNPIHRFLSLTGVILDLAHVKATIHPQMEDLKSKYFNSHPDDPVILHRKEILNARNAFQVLWGQHVRNRFDAELLTLFRTWEFTVISVCLDKKKHKEMYSTWRYDPYHYCLAILLERYAMFLQRKDACGDALAESRGGKSDRRLKDSFSRLWNQGTEYIPADVFQKVLTSKQLKVKPKANNISGLQLADLIAHPSRNEILHEHGLLDKEPAPFAKKVILILRDKCDQRSGKVFGKKFI